MTHVITRACCNDASCVAVCPVNCIHPTPDDPDFLSAESLYIDPGTCIDCGACVDECPVDAIVADDELDERDLPFLQINADYYRDHPGDTPLSRPPAPPKLPDEPLHVAIVGAGPAALYAAGELVAHSTVTVDVFDRLPTPHGLVRAGVAPDHAPTKGVERTFGAIAAKRNFEYFLNVHVGDHVHHDELTERYHAVIYAVGSAGDKRLGIDGEDLPGVHPATDVVAWYNGHPDYVDTDLDLSGSRAVVIGNGNVALDVARILLTDSDHLATTDIADHALARLADSRIDEVVLMARRGIAHAAFTNSEFLALGDLDGVDVVIDPDELALDDDTSEHLAAGTLDSTVATKIRLAREYAARPARDSAKRIVFRFLTSPVEVLGDESAQALRCVGNRYDGTAVTAGDQEEQLDTGLVLRAIGYRGLPVTDLPFDDRRGVIPNVDGRVQSEVGGPTVPGLYTAGWIKRGPTGGIGRNRHCGQQTARAVLDDMAAGELPAPTAPRSDLPELIASRGGIRVDGAGWKRIDTTERKAGRRAKRPRIKIVDVTELASTGCPEAS